MLKETSGTATVTIALIVGGLLVVGAAGYIGYKVAQEQDVPDSETTNNFHGEEASTSTSRKEQKVDEVSSREQGDESGEESENVDEISESGVSASTKSLKNDVLNGDFAINNKPHTFTDGVHYYREEGNSYYSMQIFSDLIEFGDLDNDGVEDVAAVTMRTSGGTGSFYNLLLLENNNGNFSAIPYAGRTILGDRTKVKYLDIKNMTINLVALTDLSGESPVFGSTPVFAQYKLEDGDLVEKARVVQKGSWSYFNDDELDISFYYPETLNFRDKQYYPVTDPYTQLSFSSTGNSGMSVILEDGKVSDSLDSFYRNQPNNILFEQDIDVAGMTGVYLQRRMGAEAEGEGEVLHTYLLERGDEMIKIIIDDQAINKPILIVGTLAGAEN